MTYRLPMDRFVHAWLSENLDLGDDRYSIAELAQSMRESAAKNGITSTDLEKALGATIEEAIMVTLNARLRSAP